MIFSTSDSKVITSGVVMAFLAMASIHCGGVVDTPADGAAGTTGVGGGQATTGGGQTAATGAGGGDVLCSSPMLCDSVLLLRDATKGSPPPIESGLSNPKNATAARCILQKLRDHEAGSLMVEVDNGIGIPCGDMNELVSFGDGSVSLSHRTYCDEGAMGAPPSIRREIKPKSYFDACLAGDDAGLFPCVYSVTTDAAVEGDTCPCRGFNGGPRGSCVPYKGL